MILAVSGDITRAGLDKALTTVFGGWAQENVTVPPVPQVEDNPHYQVILVKKDLVQSSIRVGNLSPLSDTDPDRFAVSVMNYVLGAGGFKSRLMEKIRSDEGLAYSVWSGFDPGWKFPGVFQATTETKAPTTHRALEIMVQEIQKMHDAGITPDEFKRAKNAIINRDVFKYDEPGKIANELLTLKFEGKPQSYLTDAVKGYQDVTLEQVNAAAKKYLVPDKMILMVVGNPNLFDKPLDDFGKVKVIDLDTES
jgi:predicted Zn-dependent peptidase